MPLFPLGSRLLIEVPSVSSETASGLVLPDKKEVPLDRGTVSAIGSDVREIKIGDRVFFSRYAPDEIEIDGAKFLLLSERDVIAFQV